MRAKLVPAQVASQELTPGLSVQRCDQQPFSVLRRSLPGQRQDVDVLIAAACPGNGRSHRGSAHLNPAAESRYHRRPAPSCRPGSRSACRHGPSDEQRNGEQMTGTRTRGWPHPAGRPADDLAALLGGNPATAGPGALTRGTTVVFYGRPARPAGTSDSQADRHRQLALCRTVIAAHGGQVIAEYFDERCRGDCPWNRRPQGQGPAGRAVPPRSPGRGAGRRRPTAPAPAPPAGRRHADPAATRGPAGPAHARRHRHLGPHSRRIPSAGRTAVRPGRQRVGQRTHRPGIRP